MTLPNGDRASVNLAKLRDYVLKPAHPQGRHKARVFASAPGWASADAERLRALLLDAAARGDAEPAGQDAFGERFTLDTKTEEGVVVRSCWIVRTGEDVPRLTTCYVR